MTITSIGEQVKVSSHKVPSCQDSMRIGHTQNELKYQSEARGHKMN